MKREEQSTSSKLSTVHGRVPGSLPPRTNDEWYVLNAFRVLSPTRQQAVLVVIGSMAVGD